MTVAQRARARPRSHWRWPLTLLAALALLAGLAAGGGAGGGGGAGERGSLADLGRRLPERVVRFTVAASGDLLIHGPVAQRALENGGGRYDFRPMLRGVREVVSGADLAICHLEQPLTGGQPSGWPSFRAPAELAAAIRWAGWDVCTTASNHALDGGEELAGYTLRELDRNGVRLSGTAASPGAPRAAMLDVEGVEVAFLAYVDRGIPGTREPPAEHVLNIARADRILADARAARRRGARAVIVSVHWGEEYVARPSGFQRRLAERLTRSRAVTAVIGQHVHVVQPIVRVHGKPVVYGEGNLLSNQTAACCPPESQDGLIALLTLEAGPDGVRVPRVRYVPTWVRHPGFEVVRAPRQSAERTAAVAERGRAAAARMLLSPRRRRRPERR